MTSVPVSAMGRVMAWIGKAVVIPTSSSASVIAGMTPSSEKLFRAFRLYLYVGQVRPSGGRPPGRLEALTLGSPTGAAQARGQTSSAHPYVDTTRFTCANAANAPGGRKLATDARTRLG